MNDDRDLQQAREKPGERQLQTPIRNALHEKTNLIEVIAISIYIPAFLSLVIFAQQHPENWLVKNFGGFGIATAAVLLLGVMMAVISWFERRQKMRIAEEQRGSRSA